MPSNNLFTLSGWTNSLNQQQQQFAAANFQELQKEYSMALTKGSKKAPSPSQMIDTHQIPTKLLESSLESIDRELAERASALSEISRLLEVVEETDSTIRYHISNLRMGAIPNGKMKLSSLQSYQGLSVQEIAEDWQIPEQAPQTFAAAGQQAAQQPWPVGQG